MIWLIFIQGSLAGLSKCCTYNISGCIYPFTEFSLPSFVAKQWCVQLEYSSGIGCYDQPASLIYYIDTYQQFYSSY